MPRFLVDTITSIRAVFVLGALLIANATPVQAAALDLAAALGERSVGSADAPVVMQEFSSLNCPHCANFHKDVWPQIKAAYVDTGKVRLVMNDFPLGDLAMDAHMLARCAPGDRYFGMIDAIFATQARWRVSATPRDDLIKIAQLSGLSRTAAQACLDNNGLKTGLAAARALAAEKYGIKGTPSFIIGDTKIPGALPFEDFKDILDKALAQKGVK